MPGGMAPAPIDRRSRSLGRDEPSDRWSASRSRPATTRSCRRSATATPAVAARRRSPTPWPHPRPSRASDDPRQHQPEPAPAAVGASTAVALLDPPAAMPPGLQAGATGRPLRHRRRSGGGPAVSERCADERRIADERCELATRARAQAEAAADALRLAQRAYDAHEAAAVTAAWGADPRAIHDAEGRGAGRLPRRRPGREDARGARGGRPRLAERDQPDQHRGARRQR